MKKVGYLILILIGGLLYITGYATYGFFTNQTISQDNIFETGQLIVGLPYEGVNDGFISAENLYPGGYVDKNVEVKNLGNINFKYKVSAYKGDGDQHLYDKLDLIIKKDEVEVFNDNLNKLQNTHLGTIAASNSQSLNFKVILPEDADNTYQGKMTFVKFTFDATQTNNNTEW